MFDLSRRVPPIARLLLLYGLLGLLYNLVVPFGEPPDEQAHYSYLVYLLEHRRLPVQSFDPVQNEVQEGHHPPAYYAAVALLTGWLAPYQPYHQDQNPYLPIGYRDPQAVQQFLHPVEERFPWRGPLLAAHAARLVSIWMGCVGVLLTYRTAQEITQPGPRKRWLPLIAAATFAFTPQFAYISAAINNDNGAALVGALLAWQMVHLLRPDGGARWSEFLLIGLGWGLGLLCKVSLLALLPAIGATILLHGRLHRRSWRQILVAGGLVLVPAVIVSGWWFWRNLLLYDDPIAWNVWMATYAQFLRRWSFSWWYVGQFVWSQFTSFWGRFGWGAVTLPTWLYGFLLALTLVGIGGLVRRLAGLYRLRDRPRLARLSVLVLMVVGVLISTWRLGLAQDTVAAQGRFLFPALSAIATLLATGWLDWWSESGRRTAARVLVAGLAALSVGTVLGLLLPTHVQPLLPELPSNARAVQQGYMGEWWEVVGWQAAASPRVDQSRPWPLTLYWRARCELDEAARQRSPTSYVRLLDVDGRVVAGWDGVPTQGRFPPPAWNPDWIAPDTIRLPLSRETTSEPGVLHILVGFVEQREGELTPVSDPVVVGRVMLRPAAPVEPPPCPVGVRFAPDLRLLGYGLESTDQDGVLRLVLYWEKAGDGAVVEDYQVFVHVTAGGGELLAQADGPPCQGRCPTSLWQRGDVWRGERELALSAVPTAGQATLTIGLYDLATGDRAPAFGSDGTRLLNDQAALADLVEFPAGAPCGR
ncbi:MAG TPA: hypothetical protein ENN99_04005 [Chloroflexi bacterium]|nr:hypothetical protein [Chloroflexota bacterium]